MTPDHRRDNLIRLLESLVGREVFCIYCGVSTGSVLDIHFTPVKLRQNALRNMHFDLYHREYMGTISLFVECTWRIQADAKILAGSGDVTSEVEDVFHIVRQLENVSVTKVIPPALGQVLDFTLCFQNGVQLSVFCDTGISSHDSYTVFDADSSMTVASGSEIM